MQGPGRAGRTWVPSSGSGHSSCCYSSSELAPNPWPLNLDSSCNLNRRTHRTPSPTQGSGDQLGNKNPTPQGPTPCWSGWREPRLHGRSVVSRWDQHSRNGQTDGQADRWMNRADRQGESRRQGGRQPLAGLAALRIPENSNRVSYLSLRAWHQAQCLLCGGCSKYH